VLVKERVLRYRCANFEGGVLPNRAALAAENAASLGQVRTVTFNLLMES
jgi:hypothetical protein